jgi:hypothetical protein
VSSSGTVPRRPRPVVPGGVTATRRAIRRRGGLMGIAIACGLFVVGLIFKTLFTGSLGGAVSFVFMVMALPVMPLLGMPASGGASLLFAAVIASAVIWWVLGQVVAARVTRYPVVGWREWTREFVVIGFGLWIGAAGGLLLGALVLGAF